MSIGTLEKMSRQIQSFPPIPAGTELSSMHAVFLNDYLAHHTPGAALNVVGTAMQDSFAKVKKTENLLLNHVMLLDT